MDWLFSIDWGYLFASTKSIAELVLRASLFYLGIFVVLRLVQRREAATMNLPDLLLVVLIADAAQNGMTDDYTSITDGAVVVGTLIFWNAALDRISYRFPALGRFVHPPPLPLVRNGRMLQRNMRLEHITESELMSQLREAGVSDVAQVRIAYLEGDGRISVIPSPSQRKQGTAGQA